MSGKIFSLFLVNIQSIYSLIEADLAAVDLMIKNRLQSDVTLINQLSHYIVKGGGKRLRPALAILCARACEYKKQLHINLAVIIELIHTATLLHDDVIDGSELRRGKKTANAVWGNEASVLVGDFLYTRSFEMMVEMNSMRLMQILSNATNIIAEGEVLQLLSLNVADTTEAHYLEIIRYKTAKLFEAAGKLGAVISHADPDIEAAMAQYALHLGSAFQLIDDVLDYTESSQSIGKRAGDDLAGGVPTLPLIFAMQKGSKKQTTTIRNAIEQGNCEKITDIIAILKQTGAIDYGHKIAQKEADKAKNALAVINDSTYKQALISLADLAVKRHY